MNTNKEQLMKYFATVLRNRALGKTTENLMSKNLAFYFTRKELIELVKKRFDGTIPKEHNLIELENKELLNLVGDQMYIISYTTEKWCVESSLTTNLSSDTDKKIVSSNNSVISKKKKDETGKTA